MGVRSGPRIVNREAPLLLNESLDDWSGDNPVSWDVATESAGVYYVTESSGAARMVTDGTWMSFSQSTTRPITGKRCRISFDVVAISGVFKVEGSVAIYGISNAPAMSAGNRYTIEFTADSDLIRFSRYTDASDVTIDNISLVCIQSPSPLVLCLDSTGGYKTGPELLTSGTSGQRAATYGYHQSGDIFDNATMTGFHAKHDASSGQANAGGPVTLPLLLGKTYRVRFDCNLISGTGYGRPRFSLSRHYNYGAMIDGSHVNRYHNGSGSGGDPTYTNSCVQGKNEFIVTVTTDPTWGNSCIQFTTFNAQEYTISNMSIKELFPYNDLSGKGNTGAPQADAILAAEGFTSTTAFLDLPPRHVWDLDGTGDYINCGNDSSLNFGTGDFTIGFWINVAAWVGNWAWPISKRPGYSGMFIALTSPGYFRASLGAWFTDVIGAYSSEPAISFGTWYHFTLRRAGGSVTAYLNGNQYGTPVANTYDLGTESANNFNIGLGPDASSVLNGQVAAVQAYKAGLTHAQIKDMYNSQRSRFGL